MKRFALFAAVVVAAVCSSLAHGQSDAQQLLDAAHKPSDLFQSTVEPFDLEVDFTAQLKVPTPGHLSLKWRAKDQWRIKVAMGGFEQITVRNGEMEYTLRNAAFTPLAVEDLLRLLHFRNTDDVFIAAEKRSRIKHGSSLAYIQAHRQDLKDIAFEICMDITSHEVLSDGYNLGPGGNKRSERFADYLEYEGARYPSKFELDKDGSKTLSADVINLKPAPFDSRLLIPPDGAIERRFCPGVKPPEPINQHPDLNVQPRSTGALTVSMTVLTDGSVGDVQLIGQYGNIMQPDAIAGFKKWKFKPAMCGSEPIVGDVQIEVNTKPN